MGRREGERVRRREGKEEVKDKNHYLHRAIKTVRKLAQTQKKWE